MRVSSALVFWLGSTSIACSDTLWDHNGSVMSLLQNGDERYFFYENPRQGMRDAGVTPGTLFFDGRRIGDELHGTARVFSSKCDQPMTFFISGPILPEGRIILEGMRPVFKDCKASSEMKLDRLEFTFLQTFVPEVSLAERLGTTEVDAAGADLEAAEPSSTVDQQKPAVDVAALLKAGMGGDAAAFKELARIFAEGEGVAQSTERSMNFLKKAGELGDEEARLEWAQMIIKNENSSQIEIDQANAWLKGQTYSAAGEVSKMEAEATSGGGELGNAATGSESGASQVLLMSSDYFDYYSCPSMLDQTIVDTAFKGVSLAVTRYNSQISVDVKMQAPTLNHCAVQIGRTGTLFDSQAAVIFFVSDDHFECSVRGDCYGDLSGYQAEFSIVRDRFQFIANTGRFDDAVFLCASDDEVRSGRC